MNDSFKKHVAAIVVTYNIEYAKLIENINSYKDYVDAIIIIDNSDKSNDLFKLKKINNFYYKSLNGNYGIAKALNEGIKVAIKQRYDFALTMDQDSKFQNNLIDIYKKYIKEDIIIYSPNYLIERKRKKIYKKETQFMYWTMTSGNLLNLELFQIVGRFREDFFIDCVDYEYCLRARKKGYKILQCNNAKLIHNPGITKLKKIGFLNYKYGYMSPQRLYYQVRNLFFVTKKYYSIKAILIIAIKWLKIILLFNDKKQYLKAFNIGIKDYLKNNFGKKESLNG